MKRKLLALCLAAACLLSGCGGGDGAGEEPKKVDDVPVSDTYFGLAYYDNGPLNPVVDNTRINRLVCEAMYEGLFEVGTNFTAVPVLCSEYTGDGTTFTFTLRDDVTFWSGAKLTAADVVASLLAAQNNESSPYRERMRQVASMEARGQNQVEIVLTAPNTNFPRLLDIPVYRDGSAGEAFADGTGPFRPVTENGKTTLVANEDWHEGYLGSIRTITLVAVASADAAVTSFQTGDVSLMREPRISPKSTAIGGSVETVQASSANLHYLGVNFNTPALQNAKVRQALSAAIGRRGICSTQLQTFADPAVLPVNPQPNGDGFTLNMDADSEQAAALLAEAALEEPLSLTLLVNQDNAFKVAAAEQVAAVWRALGVTVTVNPQPYDAYMEALAAGNFDIYYGETRMLPDFDLRALLSSGGSLNYGHSASETMNAAISKARAGEDVTALYTQFLQEMPIIPLAFERDQIILRKGLIDSITPAPYNVFAGLQDWRST